MAQGNLTQLDQENADRDITSVITVLTDTPDVSNNKLCVAHVALGDGVKDLDGSGGDFLITVTVGGQTVQPASQVITFGTEVRSTIFTAPFPVPANEEVIIRVESPNGADTDVDVTATLYDAGPLSEAQVEASGDAALVTYDGPTDAEMIARTLLAGSYLDTSDIAGELATYDGPTKTELDSAVASLALEATVGALNNLSIAQLAAELETYDAAKKSELDSAVAPLALEATVGALNNLSTSDIAAELATYDGPTLAEVQSILRVTNRLIESQRSEHTGQGDIYFVDPVNGDTHASGNRGGIDDPYASVQDCHDNAITDSNHDLIILVAGNAGLTTMTEDVTLTKRYLFIRGPGRDFLWTRSGAGNTIAITADGIELCGFQLETAGTGAGNGIDVSGADFFKACGMWINDTQGHGIALDDCDNFIIEGVNLQGSGVSGVGHGIVVTAGAGETGNYGDIHDCHINNVQGDGIRFDTTGGGAILQPTVHRNGIQGCTSDGIHIVDSGIVGAFVHDNRFGNNSGVNINDSGTNTLDLNNDLVKDIWDEVLTAALHNVPSSAGRRLREVQEFQYENGAVWIDTENGVAGTTNYENGTVQNPVDSIEDANTIAASVGLARFEIAPGSTIPFAAAQENQSFSGRSWTLTLGGQSINGSTIIGAHASGICVGGGEQNFVDCKFNGVTLPANTHLSMCSFGGVITLGEAGTLFFHQCYSGVAGIATPALDFGAGIGDSNVNVRNYSGGLEIRNMNVSGSDTMSFEGRGQLVIAATCTGGTVAIRGLFTVTDNASGAVTLSDDARIDTGQIDTSILDSGIAAAVAALNNITAANVWAVTIADLSAVLGDTATALEVLTFIKHFFHDKQVHDDSSGTQKIYNGAGDLIGSIVFTADSPAADDLSRAKAV